MRRFGATVLATLLLATACTASATTSEPATAEGSQLIELLSFSAYQGPNSSMLMVNVDLLLESQGYSRDEACEITDAGDFYSFGIEVSDERTFPHLPRTFREMPAAFDDVPVAFGFSLCEIESFVEVDVSSVAAWVDKDATAIAQQAASDPGWSDLLTQSSRDGVTVLDWGNEMDISRRSAARTLGVGGAMLVADGIVTVTNSSEVVELTFDADVPRIIQRPHVRSIVERLEAGGAHTIFLSDQPQFSSFGMFSPTLDPAELDFDEILNAPGLTPWITLGMGGGKSEVHGDVAIVAIGHLTSEDAEANVSRLEQIVANGRTSGDDGKPWSDDLQIVSIEADGLVLTATFAGASEVHPFRTVTAAYFSGDSLLAIGEDPAAE